MSPIDGLDWDVFGIATAVGVGPAVLFLVFGFWPLGERVDAWARARGVPLTAETRPWITARLQRARRWRSVGAALGWLTAYVELWITRSAYETTSLVNAWTIVGGYLAGALAAELFTARSAPPSGAADLTPRRVDDYLPVGARWWARGLVVFSALVAAGLAVADPPVSAFTTDGAVLPQRVFVFGVVGLLAAVEVLPRVVVRRRQPFHSGDLLLADDALRSWSAHVVAGALLVATFVVVANQLGHLHRYDLPGEIRLVMIVLYVLLLSGAWGTFRILTDYAKPWRVPRWRSNQRAPSS
jgi:hypothetical protein